MSQRKKTANALSVGARLKQARQEHGVTIEEAAAALHIPQNQIEALEEDRSAGVFAAPVYAFGALRSYASWLSLDTQSIERSLAQQLKSADANRSKLQVHTVPRWYTRFINPRTMIALSGATVAIVVGSYIFWQVRSFWRLPQLEITQPVAGVAEEEIITVAGQTEEGVAVRINGESVPLQDQSRFEQDIALQPGITIIRVEAENVAGRIRVKEKHVLFPREK